MPQLLTVTKAVDRYLLLYITVRDTKKLTLYSFCSHHKTLWVGAGLAPYAEQF